jgi:hypothetical protein
VRIGGSHIIGWIIKAIRVLHGGVMSDSVTNSNSDEDNLVIPISLPKETIQHLQVIAEKRGHTVEEFLVNLIVDSVRFLRLQENVVKDFENWKVPRLIRVIPTENFGLKVTFEGDLEGEYDMKDSIEEGGVFSALADIEFFRKVSVSEYGDYISWPGKIDIGADTIYWDVMFAADDKW